MRFDKVIPEKLEFPTFLATLSKFLDSVRNRKLLLASKCMARGLISLSLLTTTHRRISQDSTVRSSTQSYLSFNLVMVRSPPFRVHCQQLMRPIQTRFRYASIPEGLKLATDNNSQAHYAKGTPLPHLKRASTACRQLVSDTISLP